MEEAAKWFHKAAKWFHKAAEQGNASAQKILASMYFSGRGVPADKVTAYAWNIISGTNGEIFAFRDNRRFGKELTPDQITKAQALAKEMISKNPKLIRKNK